MTKKYLTKDQRRNYNIVIATLIDTLTKNGRATLDCGHTVGVGGIEEVNVYETEDGTFKIRCKDCIEKKKKRLEWFRRLLDGNGNGKRKN